MTFWQSADCTRLAHTRTHKNMHNGSEGRPQEHNSVCFHGRRACSLRIGLDTDRIGRRCTTLASDASTGMQPISPVVKRWLSAYKRGGGGGGGRLKNNNKKRKTLFAQLSNNHRKHDHQIKKGYH